MSRLGTSIAWLRRASKAVPEADRRVLLNPFRLAARFAAFAARRATHTGRALPADDVTLRDPDLVELLVDGFRLLARDYFRFEVEGLENVPATGPVLLVGNHSGALLPLDGFFASIALHDRYGGERVPFALVHDFVFDDPLLRSYAARLGMLRAGHEGALHAFERGHVVLVFPGSDQDAFRPFRDRNKVVLAGRMGFLKLAIRAKVPIVPVVSAGTHEQLVVLSRGERLAKILHAHAWARADVFPIVLSLPWGITSGFMPYVPLPTQVTQAFAPAIDVSSYGPEAADDPAVLSRLYRQIEDTMQSTLDRLTRGRRFLLGRPSPHA
jgi:1-acyl-sn-glycerol-3-phosphate acyltransferase